jgi:hypothetical protein
MSQDFGWLTQQGDKPEPRQEFITTLWRMRGTSGRNVEFAAFRVETGLELRTTSSARQHHDDERYVQSTPLRLERVLVNQMEGSDGFAHGDV